MVTIAEERHHKAEETSQCIMTTDVIREDWNISRLKCKRIVLWKIFGFNDTIATVSAAKLIQPTIPGPSQVFVAQ